MPKGISETADIFRPKSERPKSRKRRPPNTKIGERTLVLAVRMADEIWEFFRGRHRFGYLEAEHPVVRVHVAGQGHGQVVRAHLTGKAVFEDADLLDLLEASSRQ